MSKSKGILLCAWGKVNYGYAAFNLAASIKAINRAIPITLISDQAALSHLNDQHKLLFDHIDILGSPVSDPGIFKVSIYDMLPYDYTLYIDVDALCINDPMLLIDKLVNDFEKDNSKYYRCHVHGWYDNDSPNDLPLMYWATKEVIWNQYKFTDQRLPASQSSIQFIAKCEQAEVWYKELVELMVNNPIPLDQLKNRWGGTQPDELYLNIQIAKTGLTPDIEGSMWFVDNAAKRPFELIQLGYTFLSYFGVKMRMKTFFLEYYDKELVKTVRQLGFENHNYKTYAVFSDKHAGNKVQPIKRVQIVNPPYLIESPHIKSDGWGMPAFENGILINQDPNVPNELTGTVHLYLCNMYDKLPDSRRKELMEAHRLNCENPLITKIFNFGNVPYDNAKVINIECSQRPTYQDLIDHANTTAGDYTVITNSDLYYDTSLAWIGEVQFNKTMLALCRWNMHGKQAQFEAYKWSQGTWIFKHIIELSGMNYQLGLPGCENAFVFDANRQGYQVMNPSVDIKAYHLHASNYRTYTQADRIHGNGYLEIKICPIKSVLKKRMLIDQPGAVGDIIRCLPIAKYYSDKGFKVDWLCPKIYHHLFDYVDYVKPVASHSGGYDQVIDLSFGINQTTQLHKDWIKEKANGLNSFLTLKYRLADVPITQCNNLQYIRNHEREKQLFKLIAPKGNTNYSVNHLSSNYGTAAVIDSELLQVPFEPIQGYSIFDWRLILERATEIHCIDSSLVNFVNCITVKAKCFYYITDKVPMQGDRTLISDQWQIINQLEYAVS